MIAYFDTSAIVPLLIDEPGTEMAREHWLVVVAGDGALLTAATAEGLATARTP